MGSLPDTNKLVERNPTMTKTRNQQDVIQRLPCLVAHLIAESPGYVTPQSAAHANVTSHRAAVITVLTSPSGNP